ncbi:hypothetical protein CBS101457_000970 [Exobasidium rhododendri]|nr:hypothetical protein CBS101457_000970 [Exobasidium rhododendri]
MRSRPDLKGTLSSISTLSDVQRNGSLDGSSDAGSTSSTTPLSGPAAQMPYATHRDLVNSSDTLRLIPSSGSELSPGADKGVFVDSRESQVEEGQISRQQSSHETAEGTALRAAKGLFQSMNTKRILVASSAAPGQAWEIMQGRQDAAVEEQINALELEDTPTSGKSGKGTEISRTPSQSTTGTFESNTTSSLDTAASSLQSNPSSETALHEKEALIKASQISSSPGLYVTASNSCEDLTQVKRDSTALRRYYALLELVETEKGYAEDLSILVNVFFENLTAQAFFDESELRLNAVCRNAKELLELHTMLAHELDAVVEESGLTAEAEGSDLSKALRCEGTIVHLAQRLVKSAPQFNLYQLFCSRHTEALVLIREAEKRHGGDDFAAYERMCSNIIRGQLRNGRGDRYTHSRRSSAGTSTPLALSSMTDESQTIHATSSSSSSPNLASGATTPSGSFASLSRQNTSRLLFADYLIKPIQRLCLYPLVLNSLLKYTPEEEMQSRQSLQAAIVVMRQLADDVDQASKEREKNLMADLIISKVEPQQGINHALLKSFGNPLLSGALDVLYHHNTLSPLTVPLRFQRFGVLLWQEFLLLVRVRKSQQLECKYWFPLSKAILAPLEDTAAISELELVAPSPSPPLSQANRSVLPFAMRLSYFGHHFEFLASNTRECLTWHNHFRLAMEASASSSSSSSLPVVGGYPCNLVIAANVETSSVSLPSVYNNNVKASTSSISTSDPLVKLPSASTRMAIDRNMIFSDILLSQSGNTNAATSNSGGGYGPINYTQRDISEAILKQQLRQSATPSIGSAVGAAMGLARLAAKPTAVKRARRQSTLTLTEINPSCDAVLLGESSTDAGNSSTNTTRHSTSASRPTFIDGEATEISNAPSTSKWRNSLLRRNSRTSSARSSYFDSAPPSPSTPMMNFTPLSVAVPPLSVSPSEDINCFVDSASAASRPAHLRTKSMSLRDVWQNSVRRRSRSQSNGSDLAEMQRESGLASPATITASLIANPVLEDMELQVAARKGEEDERSDLANPSEATIAMEDVRRSIYSLDSATASSIAHLRRLLSASPRSRMSSSKSNMNRSSTASGPINASDEYSQNSSNSSSTVNVAKPLSPRGTLERAMTAITIPSLATSEEYDGSQRRRSEPRIDLPRSPLGSRGRGGGGSTEGDGGVKGRERGADKIANNEPAVKASFTTNARNSLRRLRRKSSFTRSPSPLNGALSLTNPWGDHSRLNSVEESNTEHSGDHSHLEKEGHTRVDKEDKLIRPEPIRRRPSSAE